MHTKLGRTYLEAAMKSKMVMACSRQRFCFSSLRVAGFFYVLSSFLAFAFVGFWFSIFLSPLYFYFPSPCFFVFVFFSAPRSMKALDSSSPDQRKNSPVIYIFLSYLFLCFFVSLLPLFSLYLRSCEDFHSRKDEPMLSAFSLHSLCLFFSFPCSFSLLLPDSLSFFLFLLFLSSFLFFFFRPLSPPSRGGLYSLIIALIRKRILH